MLRHVYAVKREPLPPCADYPEGVPEYVLTARPTEHEAQHLAHLFNAAHADFPFIYTTSMEPLQ